MRLDPLDAPEVLEIMKGMLRRESRKSVSVYPLAWNEALHTLAKKITGISLIDPSPLGKAPEE